MKRSKGGKLTEQEKYILTMGVVTNWSWNDEFLAFCDNFCKNKDYKKSRRIFNYYANKLVKKGVLRKARKVGIGHLGFSHFRTRTQTIWERKNKREV